MTEFLRNSDAFVWSIEHDPRLRSTIVSLILLDRSPDWGALVSRFELLTGTVPMFRQRIVSSSLFAPPHWEFDPDFDLAFHLRRVTAAAPADFDTVLEMARIAAMADFDRARPLWEVTFIEGWRCRAAVQVASCPHGRHRRRPDRDDPLRRHGATRRAADAEPAGVGGKHFEPVHVDAACSRRIGRRGPLRGRNCGECPREFVEGGTRIRGEWVSSSAEYVVGCSHNHGFDPANGAAAESDWITNYAEKKHNS